MDRAVYGRALTERAERAASLFATVMVVAACGVPAARPGEADRADAAGGLCTGTVCIGPVSPSCGAPVVVPESARGRSHAVEAAAVDAGCDAQATSVNWMPDADVPDAPEPPTTETFVCPPGDVRYHVLDMWSNVASPTLNDLTGRPLAVVIVSTTGAWPEYWARQETDDCGWYSACVPATVTSFELKAIGGANACSATPSSGRFDTSALATGEDLFIDYGGTSSTLAHDYAEVPVPLGASSFQVTTEKSAVRSICSADAGPPEDPSGFLKIHIRWPWGDPAATGFAGTDCEQKMLGYSTPAYPSSLKIQGIGGACDDLQATLDFADGNCPWYTALVPLSVLDAGAPPSFTLGTPDWALQTASLMLPTAITGDELWLSYGGPPDNDPTEGAACEDYSNKPDMYHFYGTNPGPGYEHCGGSSTVVIDPCNPPVPTGYSPVHFRYVWAGQKTFTYFPDPAFMPKWMILEVNGDEVACFREADRPWFNCPVPDADFGAASTWRAVDKTRSPEWNTVQSRPFAVAPGEYWLRWDYGKPDTTTGLFGLYSYYPDSAAGDWSATGNWNDQACAPKPPPSPVTVSYNYGGWFPYAATNYAYGFGGSLASVYASSGEVQALFNALVFQRYETWKANYLETDALACGTGSARVHTDPPETVSEGQGYGIAMAAAIGDKPTFDALFKFTRQYLSQSAKKYCGGLMGWMWDGPSSCRPIDTPCDPDTESCGGNGDSAFDGDVDIGIGLVFAALQWPEYMDAAIGWVLKMECEINTAYDGTHNYPAPGDTWDKNCGNYPNEPCSYTAGAAGTVNLSYDPPGYFRVFGDFLAANLDPATYSAADRAQHQQFWYKTAETVYRMFESCYDQPAVHPGLVDDFGHYGTPCDQHTDNYNWSRSLWRAGVDAAWFGNRTDLPEDSANSSSHYPNKTEMQAKIDNIQAFYNGFYKNNPPEPNANMFSTICQNLTPAGTVTACDPGLGHNSYFVNTAMTAYASVFDSDGETTPTIRRQAIEEAVSTTVENDQYYQESIGVYTLMFLTGNFPNPMTVH